MQIDFINSIRNIGRLNYSFKDDVRFGKTTIIYGENATGKTTFTSCVKSLLSKNPAYITCRKNINSTNPASFKISLKDGGNTHAFTFNDIAWTCSTNSVHPKGYVFDKEYITKNLFTIEPTKEHKERMFKIYLGEVAPLARLREKAKTLKKKHEDIVSKTEKAILDKFNKLNSKLIEIYLFPKTDLATIKRIKEQDDSQLEKEISVFENLEKISKIENLKLLPNNLTIESINKLKEINNVDLNGIKDDAKNELKTFLEKSFQVNEIPLAKDFISKGLKLKQANTCPFCNQQFSSEALKLIELYESVLSEKVTQIQQDIGDIGSVIKTTITNQVIKSANANLVTINTSNTSTLKLYYELMREDKDPEIAIDLSQNIENYITALTNLLIPLRDKYTNLFDQNAVNAVNICLEEIKKCEDLINEKISTYNKIITDLNEGMQKKKETLMQTCKQLDKKYSEFQQFSMVKTELFDKFRLSSRTVNKIKTMLEKYEKEIVIKSRAILDTKKNKVNEILRNFNVDFVIDKVAATGDIRNTNKSINFIIKHKNNSDVEIPLSADDNKPSFKNFLSEGDKNVLAFAFFIADITEKPNLSDAIIIFDDPVSSFDIERNNTFGFIIRQYITNFQQLIICSHDKLFLCKMLNHIDKSNFKIIEIQKNPNNHSESIFASSSEDMLFKETREYLKYISVLKSALNTTVDLTDIKEALRKLSEFYLQVRYACSICEYSKPLGGLLKSLEPVLPPKDQEMFKNLNDASKDGAHYTGEEIVTPISKQDEAIPYINMILPLYGAVT